MRHNLMKFRLGVGGDLEVKRLVIKKGKKTVFLQSNSRMVGRMGSG